MDTGEKNCRRYGDSNVWGATTVWKSSNKNAIKIELFYTSIKAIAWDDQITVALHNRVQMSELQLHFNKKNPPIYSLSKPSQ